MRSFIDIINASILLEDKVDYLRTQNVPSKIPNEVFNQLIDLDQTTKKAYIQWIVNLYNKKQLRTEDFYKVTEYLTNFEKYRSKLPNKDINFYKSLPDLAKALVPYETTPVNVSKRQIDKQKSVDFINSGQAELFYKGPEGLIIIPKTEEASCWFGQGTKWCTAATKAENRFKYYNPKGTIYILLPKGGPKFQFQIESFSLRDATDAPITLTDVESWPLVQKFMASHDDEIKDLVKNLIFDITDYNLEERFSEDDALSVFDVIPVLHFNEPDERELVDSLIDAFLGLIEEGANYKDLVDSSYDPDDILNFNLSPKSKQYAKQKYEHLKSKAAYLEKMASDREMERDEGFPRFYNDDD